MSFFPYEQLFESMPQQKIAVKDLRQGDIVKIHDEWILVRSVFLQTEGYNHGFDVSIDHYQCYSRQTLTGVKTNPRNNLVPILDRVLFNSKQLEPLLARLEKEALEHERQAAFDDDDDDNNNH